MGGTTLDYSLLTSYFLILDKDLNPIDELYLYLRPDDGVYKVCGQAMNVNRIDLKVHDTKAITYKEAGTKLYQFLKKNASVGHSILPGVNKIDRLIPVGHGIYGDISFITHFLMKQETWETFVSYRKLDTQAVCQFLKACGKFPDEVSGSLESIGKYFGIALNENELHDAKTDTLLTVEVFKKLKELIR